MPFRAKPTPQPMERRRFARVKLVLPGRYMLEDRREFPCQTMDVSVGGLCLTAPVPGAIGEKIVAYFEALGRIEGVVVRRHEFGFAISASMSPAKREKMVNQLTWLANRQYLDLPEDRRYERIAPPSLPCQVDSDHWRAAAARQVRAGATWPAHRFINHCGAARLTPVVKAKTDRNSDASGRQVGRKVFHPGEDAQPCLFPG